jgi:hypothetical protein
MTNETLNYRVENVTPILSVQDMSGEMTISPVLAVTREACTYAKADKDYPVHGFGSVSTATSSPCSKAFNPKESQ